MNLNQLYYFQTIARLQHFTRAAEELHISQPSLSYAMSSLEKELNTRLFEKQGRNIILTKYGKVFLEYVSASLNELEMGKLHLKKYTSSEQGQIDIGYVYPLAPRYIPKLARSFLNESTNKDVTFTFYQGDTSNLIDGLKSEKYDVVFSSQIAAETDIEFIPLLQHSLTIVVPKEHPLASKKTLSLASIADYPLVVYNGDTGLGQLTHKALELAGIFPNITAEAGSEQAIYGLVEAGFGISLAAKIPEISQYQVTTIDIEEPYCQRHIHMAYIRNRFQPAALKRFVQYSKEHIFEL